VSAGSGSGQSGQEEHGFDNRMVPVMREAVFTVQMVLFRLLKEDLAGRCPDWPDQERAWLAGAVVNNLFGTEPADSRVREFARSHRERIEEEIRGLATRFADMIPHLTDALRMQTICDNQEGIHSIGSLLIARDVGLLDEERVLPMPSTFMLAVRRLAGEHGLIERNRSQGM